MEKNICKIKLDQLRHNFKKYNRRVISYSETFARKISN